MTPAWGCKTVADRKRELLRRGLPPELLDLTSGALPFDREGVLRAFADNVYGNCPIPTPESSIAIASSAGSGGTAEGVLNLRWSDAGRAVRLGFAFPRKEPTAVFLLISHNDKTPSEYLAGPDEFWPHRRIAERGYASVVYHAQDVDPDNYLRYEEGVRSMYGGVRNDTDWGTVAAWAWGASRVLDALGQVPWIDPSRVAVIGHSRGGKTALWAAAQDVRFKMAVSNESGCSGATLSRGAQGETVAQIQKGFPAWFCRRYLRYADDEGELPVDQHELLALIAPRLSYVASASEDAWADPEVEHLALLAAGRFILGQGGEPMDPSLVVEVDRPAATKTVAYHVRTGAHDLTEWDWDRFLDFADGRL